MIALSEQKHFLDDNERWPAIVERDEKADGRFFYGVKTTGVYCRPNCKSRQPRRENVLFFDSTKDAELAGFRACQRCRPCEAVQVPHLHEVVRACRQIQDSASEPSLQDLAAAAGLSRFHFLRTFKSIVGITPKQYAKAQRLHRLRGELRNSPSVTAAIYQAGFNSSGHVYEDSAVSLGMTPGTYKARGSGARIRFALVKTYLDWTLVAGTDQGICMIAFGDSRQALTEAVRARFPLADLCESEPDFDEWVQGVLSCLECPSASVNLPLDIQGTAFQQRVWQALRQIPPGQTASYAEVARRIGQPTAVRAVARACATNDLAIVVPCHRVVGSDGKMHGYRWGVSRKEKLLDRERSAKSSL